MVSIDTFSVWNSLTMEARIPDDWKRDVCAVLQSGNNIHVVETTARRPWEAAFPNDTKFDLFDTLVDALNPVGLIGRVVTDMKEPGEVYEFLFSRDRRLFVGKINLCPGRKSLIIYSAHISLKGDKI